MPVLLINGYDDLSLNPYHSSLAPDGSIFSRLSPAEKERAKLKAQEKAQERAERKAKAKADKEARKNLRGQLKAIGRTRRATPLPATAEKGDSGVELVG